MRPMKNGLRIALLGAALLASTGVAPAARADAGTTAGSDAGADATRRARALFDAGARAYQAGAFRTAIQAFEEAYKVEARPNILFSIAQAHRRQYVLDKRAGHVAVALKYYRQYLAEVAQGGRRADTVAALGELEPLAARLQQEGQLQPLGEADGATRLVVSSPSEGATVALDGEAKPRTAPLIAEVTPGKHTARIEAPGFAGESREIDVARGAVTALDIPLHELPGRLAIGGLRGAEVTIDNRSVGTIPSTGPVEVTPGHHSLRVTRGGHEELTREIDIGRGGTETFDARLPLTKQRKVSYGLIGAGAAATGAGVVFGILTLGQQAVATGIKSDIDQGKVSCPGTSCPKFDQFNAAVNARDQLRIGTGVLLGGGLATAATGFLLYLFDEPQLRSLARPDEAPAPAPFLRETNLEVSAAPVVGPGLAGAALTLRF